MLLVYAQKANFGATAQDARTLIDVDNPELLFNLNTNIPDSDKLRFPKFKIHLQPDVVMLGFELDADEAKGNTSLNDPFVQSNNAHAGWFFVFRERPGNIRLDWIALLKLPVLL